MANRRSSYPRNSFVLVSTVYVGSRFRKKNIAKARASIRHFYKRDAKIKKTVYKMRVKLEEDKLYNEQRMKICPKCNGAMLKLDSS